jgi:hypothetical protein
MVCYSPQRAISKISEQDKSFRRLMAENILGGLQCFFSTIYHP